jgi:5-formyltetrahydrofolate cyclo-ligase
LIDRPAIRTSIRQRRRELPLSIQSQAAHTICDFIQQQPWFQQASHIAFYTAVRGEIDPYLLLGKACALGKTSYLPVLSPPDHEILQFIAYTPGDPMTINEFGILEPLVELHTNCKLTSLDCVFVPLIAFDDHNQRLGSGKGYYDKTFSHLLDASKEQHTKFIGLAYDFQKMEDLQPRNWDVPLDKCVVFDTVSGDVY